PVWAALRSIGSFLAAALMFGVGGLAHAARFVFGGLFKLIRRSKVALIAVAIAVLVLAGVAVDTGLNWGKVYPGIKVGSVDVGGKTAEEAQTLLRATYAPRLNDTTVTIYASETAQQNAVADTLASEGLTEQQSLDEARLNTTHWTTDGSQLQASYDAADQAAQALAVGRGDGGIAKRVEVFFSGATLAPQAKFAHQATEALAQEIDRTIGKPRLDYSLAVVDGIAAVVPGHDGDMIDRNTFENELNAAFLQSESADVSFVAHTDYAPLRIDEALAQKSCALVNAAVSTGADFTFKQATFHADPSLLGSWVQTRVAQGDEGYTLEPYIEAAKAKTALIDNLNVAFTGENLRLEFVTSGDEIAVNTNSQATMPQVQGAIEALDTLLFKTPPPTQTLQISVEEVSIPATLSFDEALSYGLITCFADYTTEYTAGVVARNHNIHLVADLLDNSIVKSGGTWSFNTTAGNCNEEAGFQAAGSIVDGEYTDEIGGGICQVATTVFNAVYNAGFPVLQRVNHSLYIASYPAGRDAAVSYPSPDLVWKNDSTSDVLFKMSYTDTTVVARLYGVNPEYRVETREGEWSAGEKFKTKTVEDATMQQGSSYVKTSGADGRKITIVRSVTDKHGALLHEDVFESNYDPKDEVKVVGTIPKTTQ
ncbi:MAG: VanW family protein, partial [Raoultibacter sp.]